MGPEIRGLPAIITFSPARVTALQSAILAMTVIGVFVTLGRVGAWSVALGGLISILPNAYFAHCVFRHAGARSMEKVVRSAYQGELVKLLLMGAGFALVFALVKSARVSAVFGGFLVVHIGGLLAEVHQFRRQP
jgi:ATP synthase protein I